MVSEAVANMQLDWTVSDLYAAFEHVGRSSGDQRTFRRKAFLPSAQAAFEERRQHRRDAASMHKQELQKQNQLEEQSEAFRRLCAGLAQCERSVGKSHSVTRTLKHMAQSIVRTSCGASADSLDLALATSLQWARRRAQSQPELGLQSALGTPLDCEKAFDEAQQSHDGYVRLISLAISGARQRSHVLSVEMHGLDIPC